MQASNTLGCCFKWSLERIPRVEAEILAEAAFGVQTSHLYTREFSNVSSDHRELFSAWVTKRERGIPIAYLTGKVSFWTLSLHVTPDVLIPRSETELLVEVALGLISPNQRVLDLGTGSGAIALALRSEKKLDVVASDLDERALAVCRKNSAALKLPIKILQSDWYENITGKFNLIVANPPYVAQNDDHLTQGDLPHEPTIALVSGPTGFEALEHVIFEAKTYLVNDGWLVVEHGYLQRDETQNMFKEAGFSRIQRLEDYSGHPRITWGQHHE